MSRGPSKGVCRCISLGGQIQAAQRALRALKYKKLGLEQPKKTLTLKEQQQLKTLPRQIKILEAQLDEANAAIPIMEKKWEEFDELLPEARRIQWQIGQIGNRLIDLQNHNAHKTQPEEFQVFAAKQKEAATKLKEVLHTKRKRLTELANDLGTTIGDLEL